MSKQAKQEAHRGGAPKGHPRYGGGIRKGQKTRKTLEKEAALALLRQKVSEQIEPLVEAQIDSAVGIRHLMFRDPKCGKFVRAEDEKQMDVALKLKEEGGESFWVYVKDPSTQAFTDLINRTLGKRVESLTAEVTVDGGPVVERILARMKRTGDGHG